LVPEDQSRERALQSRTRVGLRLLRLFAIVLPIVVIVVGDLVRDNVFPEASHTPLGLAVTYGTIAALIIGFSFFIFGVISRLQRRITDQNQQLSTLNALAMTAAGNLDLEELLGAGLNAVLATMRVDMGLICLIDHDRGEHSAVCHQGFPDEMVRNIQRAKLKDDAVATEVVRTGRPVVFAEIFKDPEVRAGAARHGIKDGISTPLRSEGEVIGVLAIATGRSHEFTEVEIGFLSNIGSQLGVAVRKALLYKQVVVQNDDLNALLSVGKTVTASTNQEDIFSQSLEAILEVHFVDAVELWLPDGDHLAMNCHRGDAREAFLGRVRLDFGEDFVGLAARDGDPLITHTLDSDPRLTRRNMAAAGFRTYAAIPLGVQDELLGVLTMAAYSEEALEEPSEVQLLNAIGEWISIAIRNYNLYQQVQDQAIVEERERIAREMHDSLGQVLGYISAQTLAVKKFALDGNTGQAVAELEQMHHSATDLYADVREGILSLRTSTREAGGLIPALRKYIRRYQEMCGIETRMDVDLGAEGSPLLSSTEIQLLRVVQEALSNVRKHAQAGQVVVHIGQTNGRLDVEVRDDGTGFDPENLTASGWPRFGLRTMRERAESVGGTFQLDAPPGGGTRIAVSVPTSSNGGSTVG
jgi:signal transduction histidine kinase